MIPPQGTPERLRYTYWLHYSESNIMMLNIMALVFRRMPEKAPFFIKPLLRAIQAKAEHGNFPPFAVLRLVFYGPQLKLHLQFIEDELSKSTWFAGEELTGAGPHPLPPQTNLPTQDGGDGRYNDEFCSSDEFDQGEYPGDEFGEDEGFHKESGGEGGL